MPDVPGLMVMVRTPYRHPLEAHFAPSKPYEYDWFQNQSGKLVTPSSAVAMVRPLPPTAATNLMDVRPDGGKTLLRLAC